MQKKGRTDCSDKTKRADADGLSRTDHEIYLLVQAGLTARKAFQKIALDYGKREDGSKRAAYEEIRTACYEMDSGISEAEAYRRFGERCGQVKYKTLSTLLIQNLQKGSRYLSDLLEKEAVEAGRKEKRKSKRYWGGSSDETASANDPDASCGNGCNYASSRSFLLQWSVIVHKNRKVR